MGTFCCVKVKFLRPENPLMNLGALVKQGFEQYVLYLGERFYRGSR